MPDWNKAGDIVYSADEVSTLTNQRTYDIGNVFLVMTYKDGEKVIRHAYQNRDALVADIRFLAELHADDEIVSVVSDDVDYITVNYKSHWCINRECEHVPDDNPDNIECPTPEIRSDDVWIQTASLFSL